MAYEWKDFSVVFSAKPDYSFDTKLVEAITKSRKELGGQLFFDRIWTSVGLKQPSKYYPPRSNADLRNLWTTITSKESIRNEPKLSLLYYLIRNVKIPKTNLEATFLRQTFLPQKYRTLVSGLWEMDHSNFTRALEYLTDPGIAPPTYADEILSVLVTHPKSDAQLAVAFYLTVSPPLETEETLNKLFDVMIQTNVVEAYNFVQAQAETRHQYLFERLLVQILSEHAGNSRAERMLMLTALPFTIEEQKWFEECLLHGSGAGCSYAKDTVLMRRIATGRNVTDTGNSSLNRLRGPKVDNINWDDIRVELKATKGQ